MLSFSLPSANIAADLASLTAIVSLATHDSVTRSQINAAAPQLHDLIQNPPADSQQLRLFRGILLAIRNTVVDSNEFDMAHVVSSLCKFRKMANLGELDVENDIYAKTLVVYYQIMANYCQSTAPNDERILHLASLVDHVTDECVLPALLAIRSLLNPDQIYQILTTPDGHKILDFLTQFAVTDSPTDTEMVYIECWQLIMAHETFGRWIKTHRKQKIMKILQIGITSKEDWNNHQLIAILSWLFEEYKFMNTETIKYFENSDYNELETIHYNILIVLDCISELCKYNIVKDFMINYKIIETLIPLLGAIHTNIQPKNITKQSENAIDFPHVKSIIIEILSYLVFDNFESQELVRECHGLELILSNCIIDDNNPFIKERAIICLKYLLANNAENQKLVASLEAKREVDANVLEEIGPELNISDGNLRLKEEM